MGRPHRRFTHRNRYRADDLEAITTHLERFQNWLKSLDIEYLFFVVPNKHTIYPEHLPDHLERVHPQSALDQLLLSLRRRGKVLTTDLRPLLLDGKEDNLVYFPTDMHWTHAGAHLAQAHLFGILEQPFPQRWQPRQYPLVVANNGRPMDSNKRMLGIATPPRPKLLPRFPSTSLQWANPQSPQQRHHHTWFNPRGDGEALVFRNSFFFELKPYFIQQFARMTFINSRANTDELLESLEKDGLPIWSSNNGEREPCRGFLSSIGIGWRPSPRNVEGRRGVGRH